HPLDARMDHLEGLGVTPFITAAQKLSTQRSNRLQMAGILIRKQERVSAKTGNKFAFLQLSDATGVFEVMIFSDILAKYRDILEPGTALLVNVDADTREEEVRFTGQLIEPLDEAVASKVREVKIHIDAAAPLEHIKNGIQNAGQGNVKIHIYAHLDDGKVAEMEIKGRHNVPPELMSMLQKSPGFLKYSEG
ncbi:MAG: OB-fold nucleic acid binding domain-containing protein, partial [Pseudomonadota bacterium]